MSNTPPPFDLRAILDNRALEIHFQPITSIRRNAVIGLEALCRGKADDGTLIPPFALFKVAEAEGLTLELDRLSREVALEQFATLAQADPRLLLFTNIHERELAQEPATVEYLAQKVESAGISPHNVAIEILEARFDQAAALQSAVACYKERGFLTALDDIGAGHSNLDRIAFIKPDILKADRALLQDIDSDYHKQEVFGSLVRLSEKIGGWIVAEGIETEAEALSALDLGADMMQGFYFQRPQPMPEGTLDGVLQRANETGQNFKRRVIETVQRDKERRRSFLEVSKWICEQLSARNADGLEMQLRECLEKYPKIESGCVLDESGVQTTETVYQPPRELEQKVVIFHAPPLGTDHSLKEYFYLLGDNAGESYISVPYVPLPTGDLCHTVSTRFACAQKNRILCLHFFVAET